MIGQNLFRWHGILSAVAALSSVACGNDMSYSNLVQRLDQLEQTVANQQRELLQFRQVSHPLNGADFGDFLERDADLVKTGSKCDTKGCRGGPFAIVECTALRPYVSGLNFGRGFTGLDADYKPGIRFVAGYEGRSGLGFRTRYWYYDQDFLVPSLTAPNNIYEIDIDVVDAETTFRGEFCNWQLQVAGGFRYGRSELSLDSQRGYYEGVGVTVALDVSRPFYRHWSLLGGFRGSLLAGRLREDLRSSGPPPLIIDETTQIWEINLGFEYRRAFRYGEIAFHALWEAQDWENNGGASMIFSPADIAFAGPVFKIEFRR